MKHEAMRDTAVCTLNGDLGSCASARHLASTDMGQAVLAEQLQEAIKNPHNDDALEQLTEAVKDLHEDEVLDVPGRHVGDCVRLMGG